MRMRRLIQSVGSFLVMGAFGYGCMAGCEELCRKFDDSLSPGTYRVEGYHEALFGEWTSGFDKVVIDADGVTLYYFPPDDSYIFGDQTLEYRWVGFTRTDGRMRSAGGEPSSSGARALSELAPSSGLLSESTP